MKQPLITHIQRYSVNDGGGIRTTVFFKGCPLHCAWCHNPETISYHPQLLFTKDRCTGCGLCNGHCPFPGNCTGCGLCAELCPAGARELAGKEIPLAGLINRLERDLPFYEQSGGGVTLSGGEVLSQDMGYIVPLLRSLVQRGIHTAVDTCGHVPWERFQAVLPYTDLFLYDLKHPDPRRHAVHTGRDNALILENLVRLQACGAPLRIRVPVIAGANADCETMAQLANWLVKKKISPLAVHLLPYHPLGREKCLRLGLSARQQTFAVPDNALLEQLRGVFEGFGLPALIGG